MEAISNLPDDTIFDGHCGRTFLLANALGDSVNTYRAIVTQSGENYDYNYDHPIAWVGMNDPSLHVLLSTNNASPLVYAGRKHLTKLEFINLFTDNEFATILSMSKSVIQLEAWLTKFQLTTPDQDGFSIYLESDETIQGVNGLEASGLLGSGRAAVILNG